MQQKIVQIGNSAGMVISKPLLAKTNLRLGDIVDSSLKNGKIIISHLKTMNC